MTINHLTVIPDDRIISVDGEGLVFDYPAAANLHALQWHNGAGHIEYNDGRLNRPLAATNFASEAEPFVVLWQVEKNRLLVEALRPLPPEKLLDTYTAAIQAHLDTFARTRNYDGILSATTYATSAVLKFHAEGQYAVEARDATWAKAYEIMDAIMSGQRTMPTLEEVIAELPRLTWPEVI